MSNHIRFLPCTKEICSCLKLYKTWLLPNLNPTLLGCSRMTANAWRKLLQDRRHQITSYDTSARTRIYDSKAGSWHVSGHALAVVAFSGITDGQHDLLQTRKRFPVRSVWRWGIWFNPAGSFYPIIPIYPLFIVTPSFILTQFAWPKLVCLGSDVASDAGWLGHGRDRHREQNMFRVDMTRPRRSPRWSPVEGPATSRSHHGLRWSVPLGHLCAEGTQLFSALTLHRSCSVSCWCGQQFLFSTFVTTLSSSTAETFSTKTGGPKPSGATSILDPLPCLLVRHHRTLHLWNFLHHLTEILLELLNIESILITGLRQGLQKFQLKGSPPLQRRHDRCFAPWIHHPCHEAHPLCQHSLLDISSFSLLQYPWVPLLIVFAWPVRPLSQKVLHLSLLTHASYPHSTNMTVGAGWRHASVGQWLWNLTHWWLTGGAKCSYGLLHLTSELLDTLLSQTTQTSAARTFPPMLTVLGAGNWHLLLDQSAL